MVVGEADEVGEGFTPPSTSSPSTSTALSPIELAPAPPVHGKLNKSNNRNMHPSNHPQHKPPLCAGVGRQHYAPYASDPRRGGVGGAAAY